ncbi:MAG: 30S ribosomal protein S1 [Lachnospira sp.]
MSENFAEMLANEEWKEIHTGEVVDGTVIAVKEDQIILSITGYKADGVITRSEYTSTPGVDLTTVVSVGDEMKAKVLKLNDGEGQVVLTYRKLVADNGSKKLEEAFNNKEEITATVTRVIKGGLEVVVDESRVFIPASLVSDTFVKDFSEYAGKEVTFVLTEYDPKNRKIIGDCKQLIVAKKEAASKELLSKIKEGDTIEGTVKNVTDFGAFIDLGGVDGLLHISEMSWGRTENPKKVYKVGDSVKCFVKEINGDKIALSVKYPDLNPWNDAATKYAVGSVVTGTVARMTDFGAFVQLEEGIDALLHVSQISKEHINKPEDALKIGQQIEAKVVDLNEAEKKISLSIKALLADEEPAEEIVEYSTDDAEAEAVEATETTEETQE